MTEIEQLLVDILRFENWNLEVYDITRSQSIFEVFKTIVFSGLYLQIFQIFCITVLWYPQSIKSAFNFVFSPIELMFNFIILRFQEKCISMQSSIIIIKHDVSKVSHRQLMPNLQYSTMNMPPKLHNAAKLPHTQENYILKLQLSLCDVINLT